MRKATWLMLGGVALLVFGGLSEAHAQKPSLETRIHQQHRVDGSSRQVLHSGTYRILSLIGQPVVDRKGRSGSFLQWHQKMSAAPEVASLQNASEVPTKFALEANYPNPFNPQTTISFALPEASRVQIQVFDLLGREVARLADGELKAGHHTVVFEGGDLASGVYVYRMVAGSFEQHRTMLLVK